MNLVNPADRAIRERKVNRERPEKWERRDCRALQEPEDILESWARREIGESEVNPETLVLEGFWELLETQVREEPSGRAAILDSGATQVQPGSEDLQDPKERPVWPVLTGGRGFLDSPALRDSQGKTGLLETPGLRDFPVYQECSG